jgi:hypothetical protein
VDRLHRSHQTQAGQSLQVSGMTVLHVLNAVRRQRSDVPTLTRKDFRVNIQQFADGAITYGVDSC